jgi:DNA polymerase-1
LATDPRDAIRNPGCVLCPLHEGAEHVCLMGSGPIPADIMIVGEAPGEREDEAHRAFVGKSGKLLTEMLLRVGINRRDVYITNAAKCRPPDNETPKRGHIKTCVSEYLLKELELVKPKFVLLLGNSALQGLTGKSGITKKRGTTFVLGNGITAMATFHPAAVLRNPRLGSEVDADLRRFARMVRGEKEDMPTKVRIIRTKTHLKWLLANLKRADVISWDIETYTHWTKSTPAPKKPGLQEWHGEDSQIVSIGFSWKPGEAAVLPLHHKKSPWKNPDAVFELLRDVMTRPDAKYIAHNGKFDAKWMHAKGIFVRQDFDTMLAAHMLDENRTKGLKPLSQLLLGADAYDVGEELGNAYFMPLKRLCIYNGKDCDYTLRLYYLFREQLKAEPRTARVFKLLMMPASNMLVDVERHGIWLDHERWVKRYSFAAKNRDKLYRGISKYWPEDNAINLNSPPQVARLLFNHLDLDVLEVTKTGAPTTKEAVLLKLKGEHKVCEALINYRKWEKRMNTYFRPWKYEHSDDRGRVHGSYKLFGTVTGRLSGEGGIQQVPRDTFMRALFGAEPGRSFVQGDYSQVELRIAAMLANERRMLRAYATGEDLHMLTAVQLTGKRPQDITKEERKRAKAVNFGFLYGMGAPKFVETAWENYELVVSLEEAEAWRDRFFETFKGLPRWHERQRRLARRYGRVHSPIGRIRHLPDIESEDKGVRAEAERQAINSPVQSCASDLMLTSMCILNRELDPKLGWMVGTVHDSILFDFDDGYVDRGCEIVKEVMENMEPVRRMFGADITVPIVADIEVGRHWGEGEPWHDEAA